MRADRLVALMLALQAERQITAETLARRLEVSERTIYRDVEALSTAGIPIYTQPGTNGGISLDENYRVSLTGFSIPELRTLFVASDAGPLTGLGLAQAAEATVLKLFAALPTIHKQEVERLRQRFYIDSVGWFDPGEIPVTLSLLQQAVEEDRKVSITYQNFAGEVNEYILDAYALVAKANVWYLIGPKSGGEPRTYRVTRIQHIALDVAHFERDPTFDPVAYWKESSQNFEKARRERFSFYPALLRVRPDALSYLRDYLTGRFEQIEAQDAEGWIPLRALFLSLDEARMVVLGLGIRGKVVEPIELQQTVIETAQAILALHSIVTHQTSSTD